MVDPGVALTPLSVLTTDRSDVVVSGVVSSARLSTGVGSGPLAPLLVMTTVLARAVTPAGMAGSTVTAKVSVPEPPATREPIGKWQGAAGEAPPPGGGARVDGV